MPRDLLTPSEEESLAFRAIDILKRRKILVTCVFAAVVASAITFARYLPDLYRGTAVLLVERPVPEALVRPAVSGELDSRLHVIKQEILSRGRLEDLIDRFGLYPELRRTQSIDAVYDQMRHDIDIELTGPEQVSGRKTTVSFRLSYTGAEDSTVADVTNAIANFYVSQNDEIRSQEATRATVFLKAQLESTKHELDRQEGLMRAYTASHPGELPSQVEVNLAALERLNTQVRLIGERQIKLLEDREKLADGLTVTTDAATGERITTPRELPGADRLDRMRRDLQLLQGQFTSRHPDVVRLKTEIASAEREQQDTLLRERQAAQKTAPAKAAVPTPDAEDVTTAATFRRRTVESLDVELDKLKTDETALRQNIASVEQRLESVPEREQDFGRLTRDYQAAKDLYDSLLKRYDEAQLAESLETDRQGERFRILESATPPASPMAPNRLRLIIMGFILAGVLGIGAAMLAEQFDSSFHSVDDLRAFTSVPVLAAVPTITPFTFGRAARLTLATASVITVIAIVVVLSTYAARGNEQLVWMLAKGA